MAAAKKRCQRIGRIPFRLALGNDSAGSCGIFLNVRSLKAIAGGIEDRRSRRLPTN